MPGRTPQPLGTLAGHFEAAGFDQGAASRALWRICSLWRMATILGRYRDSPAVWHFRFG
jgi:hypothetical protein